MKKSILFLFSQLMICPLLFSQINIQVFEEIKTMSLGERPAFVVDIPGGDYETIRKAWIKLLENDTKAKVTYFGNEININGAIWKKITLDSINIYSSVYKIDTVIKVVSFIEIDSVFISSEPSEVYEKEIPLAIRSEVRDFAIVQYREVYQDMIDEEEILLKNMEKEYQSLSNESEKKQKDIKGNEESIRQSEDAIRVVEADLELKNKEIEAKKLDIAPLKIKDPEAYKIAEKELNLLEREKKKLENEREKENKNIVTYKNNIKEAERAIEQLTEQMAIQSQEIELQEEIIKKLESELERIL